MAEKKKLLQVRVPDELHLRARLEAVRTGKPLSKIMEKLIEAWLNGKVRINGPKERKE